VLIPGMDAHRAVLVNGRLTPHLSDLEGLPPGVHVMGLGEALQQDPDLLARHLNRLAGQGEQVFTAINTAGLDDGLLVWAAPGLEVERPLEILHLSVGSGEPRVAQPRHLLVLGEGARMTVIERYLSLGEPLYCTNSVLELILEPGADLDHHRIQMESPNAFHLTGLYLSQARGSRYRSLNLGLGAAWSRTDLVVRFSGPHADCELNGLYLAGDKQLADFHLDVEHGLPHCTSRERFKGILYGRGRAVFDGRIHVARGAYKTDAHLSNKNLLLSRSAEVDTKPQLEIFADDVKCSHGTTVGQIDPEALFYLRSRGIPEPDARRMLCLGFAGEIIGHLVPEPLRDYAAAQVGRRLERTSTE
jgi:Fe-S cluster assembly protein SufD